MVNKVILIGRLGRDPEMRYTASGTPVANFSLATNEFWSDNGERKERTEWHQVVAWSKLGEICTQYLSKGRLVYIEGRLQTREWDDRDGNKRRTTEVVALNMQMLNGGRGDESDRPGSPAGSAEESGQKMEVGITDDDIPF
ncbi:MAG: single-stranded DNA-binding protein [Acidobacteriota bacterium]